MSVLQSLRDLTCKILPVKNVYVTMYTSRYINIYICIYTPKKSSAKDSRKHLNQPSKGKILITVALICESIHLENL